MREEKEKKEENQCPRRLCVLCGKEGPPFFCLSRLFPGRGAAFWPLLLRKARPHVFPAPHIRKSGQKRPEQERVAAGAMRIFLPFSTVTVAPLPNASVCFPRRDTVAFFLSRVDKRYQ